MCVGRVLQCRQGACLPGTRCRRVHKYLLSISTCTVCRRQCWLLQGLNAAASLRHKWHNECMQAHFRLSLGEAAQRLGVCASTLKRVCRRKGIPAWPQRKLVKLSRAVDQVRKILLDSWSLLMINMNHCCQQQANKAPCTVRTLEC